MKSTFISGLRLLAQLTREPISEDLGAAIGRSYALGETISAQFDQVRALADAVLFEFGASRRRDLAMRDQIRRWQPRLRTLFLMRMASFKYRLQLPGFELPEAVRAAQQAYDDRSAAVLEAMADRIEGRSSPGSAISPNSLEPVERAQQACFGQAGQEHLPTFTTLLRGIDQLTASLAEQIGAYTEVSDEQST
jgi:multidrug resistance protein MdtO